MILRIKQLVVKTGIGENKLRCIIARPEFDKFRTKTRFEKGTCQAFDYNEESAKLLLPYQVNSKTHKDEQILLIKEKLVNMRTEINNILKML